MDHHSFKYTVYSYWYSLLFNYSFFFLFFMICGAVLLWFIENPVFLPSVSAAQGFAYAAPLAVLWHPLGWGPSEKVSVTHGSITWLGWSEVELGCEVGKPGGTWRKILKGSQITLEGESAAHDYGTAKHRWYQGQRIAARVVFHWRSGEAEAEEEADVDASVLVPSWSTSTATPSSSRP